MTGNLFSTSSAYFGKEYGSDGRCSIYRYELGRLWCFGASGAPGANADPRRVIFIMLNPSTADAFVDDQTIKKCIGFAQRWTMDGFTVLNLFALRSTDPQALYTAGDPVGPENDARIQKVLAANPHAPVVIAWGQHGAFRERQKAVLAMLKGRRVFRLGMNKNGTPEHPLMVGYDRALQQLDT